MAYDKVPQFGEQAPEDTEVPGFGEQVDDGEASISPEVRFDSKTGTLLLGVGTSESVDPAFKAKIEGQGFTPKDELHVTVLGFKQGGKLKKLLKRRPELSEEIAALAGTVEWGLQPTGEHYVLTKEVEGEDPKQSVIEMVECPGGAEFIQRLNEITGLGLEEQPPHVTLATKGDPRGIGVNTAQDLEAMSQRLD